MPGPHTMTLIPPDDRPGWRYRDVQLLPSVQMWDYAKNEPAGPQTQPTECLVIWDLYIEREQE